MEEGGHDGYVRRNPTKGRVSLRQSSMLNLRHGSPGEEKKCYGEQAARMELLAFWPQPV